MSFFTWIFFNFLARYATAEFLKNSVTGFETQFEIRFETQFVIRSELEFQLKIEFLCTKWKLN